MKSGYQGLESTYKELKLMKTVFTKAVEEV